MKGIFLDILNANLYGSIVIVVVLLLRLVLKKAPKSVFCLLWLLAGLRLLLPFEIESSLSLQPRLEPVPLSQPVEIQIPDGMAPIPDADTAQPDAPSAAEQEIPGGYQNTERTSFLYAVEDGVIRQLTLGDIAAWTWAIGVLGMGAYSLWSYWRLKKQVREAVRQGDGCWESGSINTAFVLGFLPPRIYLPGGLPGEDRELILAHENAHIARKDHWIKLVGFLVLAVHWFNPLVWLAYSLLCRDIEMACDERVVKTMCVEERKAYSKALLNCAGSHRCIAACPVAFGEVSVKQRILSVLNYRKPGFWVTLVAVIAVVFVVVCLMTSPSERNDSENLPETVPDDWKAACAEILEHAQNRSSVHILEAYDFSGDGLPEISGNRNYFRQGDTWLDICLTESGYLGWLSADGKLYESESEDLQFAWQEIGDEDAIFPQPWLLTFDLSSAEGEVISRQETDDGYVLRLMVHEHIDTGWLQAEEYYVDFGFDHEGNFLRALLHVAEGFDDVTIQMILVDLTGAEVLSTIQQYAGVTMNEPMTKDDQGDEAGYLAKCRAALEAFQAQEMYCLLIQRQFSGDILNDNATQIFYRNGDDWLRQECISEADWQEENWYLEKDGVQYERDTGNIHNPENGEPWDTGWVEGPLSEDKVFEPWLRIFDWETEKIVFVSREVVGTEEIITIQVHGNPTGNDVVVSEYTVSFIFYGQTNNRLRNVILSYTQAWPMMNNGVETMGVGQVVATMSPNAAGDDIIIQMIDAMYAQAANE